MVWPAWCGIDGRYMARHLDFPLSDLKDGWITPIHEEYNLLTD